MISNILPHERFSIVPFGWETNRYFLLDLDRQTSLDSVKRKAFEWGKKYKLGNCLIDHSSDDPQLMLNLKQLQNYRLVYGRKFEGKDAWEYQQKVLREIRDSGVDIRYVDFRAMEKTSTLWVSPKSLARKCPEPIFYLRISGENEGIREYLKMLWLGRKLSKFLQEMKMENDEVEELNSLTSLGVIKT